MKYQYHFFDLMLFFALAQTQYQLLKCKMPSLIALLLSFELELDDGTGFPFRSLRAFRLRNKEWDECPILAKQDLPHLSFQKNTMVSKQINENL